MLTQLIAFFNLKRIFSQWFNIHFITTGSMGFGRTKHKNHRIKIWIIMVFAIVIVYFH